jgi:hypothetical protein
LLISIINEKVMVIDYLNLKIQDFILLKSKLTFHLLVISSDGNNVESVSE